MDLKITEAIDTAVGEAGQPEGIARKLTRWFEAVASGNEDLNDTQATDRHLRLLYEETQPPSLDEVIEELIAESTAQEESN